MQIQFHKFVLAITSGVLAISVGVLATDHDDGFTDATLCGRVDWPNAGINIVDVCPESNQHQCIASIHMVYQTCRDRCGQVGLECDSNTISGSSDACQVGDCDVAPPSMSQHWVCNCVAGANSIHLAPTKCTWLPCADLLQPGESSDVCDGCKSPMPLSTCNDYRQWSYQKAVPFQDGFYFGADSQRMYCDIQQAYQKTTTLSGTVHRFETERPYTEEVVEQLQLNGFNMAIASGEENIDDSPENWLLMNATFSATQPFNPAFAGAQFLNGNTPTGTGWTSGYDGGYVYICGTLQTTKDWSDTQGTMHCGCHASKSAGERVCFRSGGRKHHTGEIIHCSCNDYRKEDDHSVTLKAGWTALTRTIWIQPHGKTSSVLPSGAFLGSVKDVADAITTPTTTATSWTTTTLTPNTSATTAWTTTTLTTTTWTTTTLTTTTWTTTTLITTSTSITPDTSNNASTGESATSVVSIVLLVVFAVAAVAAAIFWFIWSRKGKHDMTAIKHTIPTNPQASTARDSGLVNPVYARGN